MVTRIPWAYEKQFDSGIRNQRRFRAKEVLVVKNPCADRVTLNSTICPCIPTGREDGLRSHSV